MASIPCTGVAAAAAAITSKSFPSSTKFNTRFVGTRNRLGWVRPLGLGPSNGSRAKCWFKFGKNGVDAEGAGIYGSQSRDDFDRDDVEQVLYSLSLFTCHCICVYMWVTVTDFR